MKSKRFLAKAIDFLMFYFLAVIFASILMSLFIEPFAEMLIGAGFDFEKIVSFDVNSLVYMQLFFTRNLNIMLIMVMFINSAVLLFAYIYFGLIGKKLSGSRAKYIFHIGVEANDGKNSSLKLLKREPIIHFLILGFISSIVSVLNGPFKVWVLIFIPRNRYL